MRMKTLTKIKLINWHGFYDDTLEIDSAVLVTGENGSGKSTLLDAIYFLLTGGEENKFNSAANEKANRTLESYMRGKTGIEGKTYLRDDINLISHIAAEFYDDVAKEPFVIGVVLEIQDGKTKIGRSFYHIKRRGISEDLFHREDGAYMNFKAMRNMLKDSEMNPLDGSRPDIRAKISGVLSLENKRYYELLPKALAFKPIGDVNDFVYKFLMPQRSVNIENVRHQIHTYNELKKQVEDDQRRKAVLERITSKGISHSEASAIVETLEIEIIKRQFRELDAKVNAAKKKRDESQTSLSQVLTDIENNNKILEGIKEQIYAIEHGEAYGQVGVLKEKTNRAKADFDAAEKAVVVFNKALAEEAQIADEYGIPQTFLNRIKRRDFSGLVQELQDYQVSFQTKTDELTGQKYSLSNELKDVNERIEISNEELKGLRRGIIKMPQAVQNLIRLLSPIVASRSPDSKPTPLCELIDLADGAETYRDVLEAALGEQRFAVFVPEHDFKACFNEFVAQEKTAGIDGAILVNVSELTDVDTAEGSLARLIKTDDPRARRFVDKLLGKALLADSQESLLVGEQSFTARVSGHQRQGVFHVDPSVYGNPVIGIEARKIRIAQLDAAITKLENEKKELESRKTQIEVLLRKGNRSSFSKSLPQTNVWQNYDALKTVLEDLSEQLRLAEESMGNLAPELNGLYERKGKLDSELGSLGNRRDSLYKVIGAIEDKLPEQESELEDLSVQVRNAPAVSMIFPEDVDRLVYDEHSSVADLRQKSVAYKKKATDLEKEIIAYMQEYISSFGFDAVASMDSYETFAIEYREVVLRNLERHSARLQEEKDKTTETFQNAYIAEIRKNIRDEEANIAKLNKVLESKPFGYDEERYRFKISRSTDKTFGRFYDIFKTNEDYAPSDLFTDQLSDKNLALMQELFQQLVSESDDPRQLRLIEDYTDYRKFMSYDIVITNKRGEESYFSKINKEKSGGETQTPFYVIIAASFDQIIHGGYGQKSTGCLVMLDEAFNNMDESHIDSMMKYFLQLDIQPIIAVPTQRAKTIMPYVNTTIGLAKINDRVYPRIVIKDEQ